MDTLEQNWIMVECDGGGVRVGRMVGWGERVVRRQLTMFRPRVWRTVGKDAVGDVLQDVLIHQVIDVQGIVVNSKSSKIVLVKLHVVNIHQSRSSQKFVRVTALKNKSNFISIMQTFR